MTYYRLNALSVQIFEWCYNFNSSPNFGTALVLGFSKQDKAEAFVLINIFAAGVDRDIASLELSYN